MNILYNVESKKYILGTVEFTKDEFIGYINGDFLQNDLIANNSVINIQDTNQTNNIIDERERVANGRNILLYGVPGCGKSWTITHDYCNESDKMERIVFHPDYTYSDFIGQLLPDAECGIKFEPGPFTRILKQAYRDYKTKYYLVIEEINRGNAPAIFGEIFQLLDRKMEFKSVGDDGYQLGTSEYGITNFNIAKKVYGDEKRKVKIPSNLTIIGTMNTSDQNVFTLDTAFQRRWDMRMIESGFDNVDTAFANAKILDTSVTWKKFCTTINNIILEKNVTMLSSEDKRLGAYFVNLKDLEFENNNRSDNQIIHRYNNEEHNTKNKFAEKIFKYLWDDAFKFYREEIFETNQYNCLEKIIKTFNEEKGNQRFKIFKENIKEEILNI